MIYYLAGLMLVAWIPDLNYIPALLLFGLTACHLRICRLPLLWFCFGAALGCGWGMDALSHRLPESFARQEVRLHGSIVGLVQRDDGRQRFTLHLSAPPELDGYPPLRRVRLSLYRAEPALQGGDELVLTARLYPPRGLGNPAAFDSERRMLTEQIDARGYVRTIETRDPRAASLSSLRQRLRDRLQQRFSPPAAATLAALLLGDRSLLDDRQWRLASETATAHLLVVSGLHVAVVAGAGLLLGRLLLPLLVALGCGGNAARRSGLLLAFVLAAGYALMAGLGLPLQRALIMLAVFLFGDWRLHALGAWQRWRYALWGVTLMQPLAVVEAGAWLSFGAVALLIWVAQQQHRTGRYWGLLLRVQLQLFVGMLPLVVVLFNQLGLLAPLVNLVAVPLVSLLVVLLPLLLPPALWGESVLAGVLDGVIGHYWLWLEWMRSVVGLYLPLATPGLASLLLASLGSLLWLLPLPLRWRWLALPLMLPLLNPHPALPAAGRFRATVFDVGQGLAVLIETAEGALLYDTGPAFRRGGSVYPYAIRPLLQADNIRRLEEVVISHDDIDHRGGLDLLLRDRQSAHLRAGQPQRLPLFAEPCQGERVLAGVRFRYLAAPAWLAEDNDRSCVLLVSTDRCSLLLPGDLTAPGERALLQAEPGLLQALPGGRLQWLVAGHHGSRSSTSAAWLNQLQPAAVIFSRGAFNAFGHPAAAVVDRVRQVQAEIYDTVRDGALILEADAGECRTRAWRQQKRRYWTAG